MKFHLREIKALCRKLNRHHLLLACGLALADWAITWALVAAFDAWGDPIREQTAATLLLLSLPLIGGLWIWGYRHNRDLFHLDLRRMAQRIENAYTDLNDLLVTAADLEERPDSSRNALEEHVLESASIHLQRIDWRARTTTFLERTSVCITVLLIAVVMAGAAFLTNPMKKAGYFLKDTLAGTPSGILLLPYPAELPVTSEITLEMQITRWENTARIHWIDAEGKHAEPVVIDPDGSGKFTFYAIESSVRFRIETPSLISDWHSIEAYTPARLDDVRIRIMSPDYTRISEVTHEQLTDLKVVEGSEISFDFLSKGAESMAVLFDESKIGLAPRRDQRFEIAFQPSESTAYRISLNDAKGRQESSPSHQLEVYADRPPAVEIIKPIRDSVLAPEQDFPLEVFAADDFGLNRARLHLKLSGSDEILLELPLENEESFLPNVGEPLLKEAGIQAAISLASLGAQDGEFLALYVKVQDNREPDANITQSDLLFIEIRTPVSPREVDGMPMEQKEINLRELIDEQKRLLRETYRAESLPEVDRANRLPELVSGLSALGVEINRVFSEVRSDLESADSDDLTALFQNSLAMNTRAIADLEAGLVDASFLPQSASLSALLKLENAFRNNTISKTPSEGKGKGQSGQGKPSYDKKDSESPFEQGLGKLEETKAALEELISQQNQLNTGYDKSARTDWSREQAENEAQAQRELAADSRKLEDALRDLPDSRAVRNPLSDAREHMQTAAGEADKANASGSLRSGLRARESLRRAAAEMDAMIADATGRQLEAAAQAAGQLASEQAEEAKASGEAAEGESSSANLADMEEKQRDLKNRYEEFLKALENQSRKSAETAPEVSQALMEAASGARKGTTGSNMERAANALLYGQPGMANPLQASAAAQLTAMAEGFSEARSQIGKNPMARARTLSRELMGTLEELASYAREQEAPPEGRMKEIREEWSGQLEELREISGDPRFGGLSGQLGRAQPDTWSGDLAQARMVLQESAGVLRQFLTDEASLSGLQINREAAPPPDQYRQMVEEYFRRLANEPSETP